MVPEDGAKRGSAPERPPGSSPCVMITVTEVVGSAPRAPGSRMLVTRTAQRGSIGGGNLEFQAVRQARELLEDTTGRDGFTEQYGLGPRLNQCCGGAVTLRFERMPEFGFEQREEPFLALTLFGAGHVGSALIPVLADLPLRVRWVDSRPGRFPDAVPPSVKKIVAADPVREVQRSPAGSLFLVMTHSHQLDEDICHEVLTRTDTPWLGLIGSKTKHARFAHRLAQRGVGAEALQRLECPVGHAGVAGKRPATIAVSIAAQLLAEQIPAEWR